MTVFIYALSDPRPEKRGAIRYVGKALNLKARMKSHFAQRSNAQKSNWIALLRRGRMKPVIEVLETIEDSDDNDWQESERWWISYLRFIGCDLVNSDSGGRGGKKASPETRAKLSASKTGKRHTPEAKAKIAAWHFGRRLSDETKAKVAATKIGRTPTAATRLKMSAAQTGRTATAETRLKLSRSLTGKKRSPQAIENMCRAQSARIAAGHVVSAETRAKMSASHIRRHQRPSPSAFPALSLGGGQQAASGLS